ncbi:MAG: substrate-binding domain-containing protein, partial [Proteobacteria bacterium]|nr:substrate-binding domain-containing protein [Pseudomonadota bacterium]
MRPLFRRLTLLLTLASGFATGGVAVGGETLTVFAAASLTEAMTEAGLAFEQSSGVAVRFSFASSSTLAR